MEVDDNSCILAREDQLQLQELQDPEQRERQQGRLDHQNQVFALRDGAKRRMVGNEADAGSRIVVDKSPVEDPDVGDDASMGDQSAMNMEEEGNEILPATKKKGTTTTSSTTSTGKSKASKSETDTTDAELRQLLAGVPTALSPGKTARRRANQQQREMKPVRSTGPRMKERATTPDDNEANPEREDGARSDGDSEYNSPDRRRQMDEGSHVGNKKLDTLPIGYHFLKGETVSPSSAGGSPSSPRSGADDAMSTGGDDDDDEDLEDGDASPPGAQTAVDDSPNVVEHQLLPGETGFTTATGASLPSKPTPANAAADTKKSNTKKKTSVGERNRIREMNKERCAFCGKPVTGDRIIEQGRDRVVPKDGSGTTQKVQRRKHFHLECFAELFAIDSDNCIQDVLFRMNT